MAVNPFVSKAENSQYVTCSGCQVNKVKRYGDLRAHMAKCATDYLRTFTEYKDGLLNELHPLAAVTAYVAMSAAKKTNTDPNTMTVNRALREPDREEFIKAMIKEIEDHTQRGH